MKIIVAPDSFKGSLSAVKAAEAIERGVKRVLQSCEVRKLPMSDGGEGLVETLISASGGEIHPCRVTGPLGEPVDSFYGIMGDGQTAVIEMAAASGLPLVPEHRKNPMITTTYGTGELIRLALDEGCRQLIIGIGGSATNDGGAGMAQALGAKLTDSRGEPIGPGGGALKDLARIDLSGMDRRLRDLEVTVACDVDNPLCGPRGAAAIYGPQKGATPGMVRELDANLAHLARLFSEQLGKDVKDVPGSGAAGGLGAGLMAFLDANLRPGIQIVIEAVRLDQAVEGASLVVTGEGRVDRQTAFGKVPSGVAAVARSHGVPVACLAGTLGEGWEDVFAHGIDAVHVIGDGPASLEESMARAPQLIESAVDRMLRLMLVGKRL